MDARVKLTGEVQLGKDGRKTYASLADAGAAIQESQAKDATELFLAILRAAIAFNASDIHFETEENGVKIRLRVDGILQDTAVLEPKEYEGLLSRVKLVSRIKLNVQDRPQDGRFTLETGEGLPLETRVSSLPSQFGESLVIRLLNPKNLRAFKDLALRPDLVEIFAREIRRPNGMILVTGPTGSGKTTTLYAFLQEVKNSEIKIITIEDPIEYHLEGVSQTQVQGKEYTFASGLRAIVRQDPDVILVGEIRDPETADIAIQAALTGHLVFSTLHTNDSAGTIARLLSLGGNAQSIAAAINLVIAQRLVRQVCETCERAEPLTEKEYEFIQRELEHIPDHLKKPLSPATAVVRAKGCEKCGHTGYRGRIGLYEALVIDDPLRIFISKNPSIAELRDYAKQHGLVTVLQDGLLKMLDGATTMEEILRVAAE
ncbi:MAG: type II/IV secretion system protein [Candidatus Wildermuthbacteria bacterium]|nr:type II/IV secretion system protein [Candidatus Wildermuthbacteria bacterium]